MKTPNFIPRRKVIYLSGTRADFGLMQSTLHQMAQVLEVSVAAVGMHLDTSFGHTVDEIYASGIHVCGTIPLDVKTRTRQSMGFALGTCLQGVTELLAREQPNMLLLLGDRGEMLAGAIAALHLGIVCVHIHGGERSGTIDESMRHAISKLSSYHCVATEESRQRLERMGEDPHHILVSGAPGLDGLLSLSLTQLAPELAALSTRTYVLSLFHPVVQQSHDAYAQTIKICSALHAVGLPVVWLEPNADAGASSVLQALDECLLPQGSRRIRHLPRYSFCAAMRHCAVMVGNSSAGIIEAASFGTPVVNVGARQHLRERNSNVVDVPVNSDAIYQAVQKSISHGPWPCQNLYGDGQAGARIVQFLSTISLDEGVLEKVNFY